MTILDVLIKLTAVNGQPSASALVSHVTTEGEQQRYWVNGGSVAGTQIAVAGTDIAIEVSLSPVGVNAWKAKVAAGDENAHHTKIGEATVNDAPYVVFPDRSGTRLGLKPDASRGEAINIASLV